MKEVSVCNILIYFKTSKYIFERHTMETIMIDGTYYYILEKSKMNFILVYSKEWKQKHKYVYKLLDIIWSAPSSFPFELPENNTKTYLRIFVYSNSNRWAKKTLFGAYLKSDPFINGNRGLISFLI